VGEAAAIGGATISGSMCDLLRREKVDRTSLRILRPAEVLGMKIEDAEPMPEKGEMAEAWASQSSLFTEGERKSVVDWEIVQLYRAVRDRENWRELIEQKWVGEMGGTDKDTAFIVGNQKLNRGSFLVLGVWWPPFDGQLTLGDTGDPE
jgi:hypothetical protein